MNYENVTIDVLDKKIMKALQQDGRMTVVQLAEAVGLSTSPCQRRLKRLEDEGYIKGYSAIADPLKLNLKVSVFISVKLERQTEEYLEKFERKMAEFPEVMECYLMSGGGRDYMLRIVTEDIESYERFLISKLTRVKGVANIDSSFALKQVLYRTALPVS